MQKRIGIVVIILITLCAAGAGGQERSPWSVHARFDAFGGIAWLLRGTARDLPAEASVGR